MNFYVENDAKVAEAAKYIPLSDEQKKTAQEELTGDDREDYRYLLMPVRLPNQ